MHQVNGNNPMCTHIHVHVHMYTYTHTHVHIHTYTYTHMHLKSNIFNWVCLPVPYAYIYVHCTYTHTFPICIRTVPTLYTHTCTYLHHVFITVAMSKGSYVFKFVSPKRHYWIYCTCIITVSSIRVCEPEYVHKYIHVYMSQSMYIDIRIHVYTRTTYITITSYTIGCS